MKLLLTLANRWTDYGGVEQYARWTGEREEAFFESTRQREVFRKYVKYVAARYETNENVFGFQLMNEPRVADGNEEVLERWCEEIVGAFREANGNHTVSLGSEGFYSRTPLELAARKTIRAFRRMRIKRKKAGKSAETKTTPLEGGLKKTAR